MTILVTHSVGEPDALTVEETIYSSFEECYLEYDTFAADGWGFVPVYHINDVLSALRCSTRECSGVPLREYGFCSSCDDEFDYWRRHFGQDRGTAAERRATLEAMAPLNRR